MLEVAENVLGFGYSITAADFDGNGYSDVIVGSLSENVFLFKSRPIIDVRSTLKPNKKSLKLDENERSVSIDFCFSFNERSNTMKENIMVSSFSFQELILVIYLRSTLTSLLMGCVGDDRVFLL